MQNTSDKFTFIRQQATKMREGLSHAAESFISTRQYDTWWEAVFATIGYVSICALIAPVINAILALVAKLTLIVGLISAIGGLLTQSNEYLQFGLATLTINAMVSLIPSILTLTLAIMASLYRAKDLITAAIPEESIALAKEKVEDCLEKATNFFTQIIVNPHSTGLERLFDL